MKGQLKILLNKRLSKMMQRKEIIRNFLIILCVFILAIISWASVIGIQDPGLLETAGIVQRSAGFVIVTALVLQLIYQTYGKPLTQEMKEEEIREAEQEDNKQVLFKPTIGVTIFFMLFILIFATGTIADLTNPKSDFIFLIFGIVMTIFFIGLWYMTPVFIFSEDSVQIKSHLFYLSGIDRKTSIRFADITSVRPDPKIKGTIYGLDRRYRILISMNGTSKFWILMFYNSDIIAKIYLRFREKLGDKVRLE
jgi:Ca2+/Na+ antiporter